jgi:hypothetical protein
MPLQNTGQRFSGDWLGQIVVHPDHLAALAVLRERVRRQRDDGDLGAPSARTIESVASPRSHP